MRLFKKREEGQGLVEYALLLVLIAIVVIGILGLLGGEVRDTFAEIIGHLGGGTVSATCTISGPNATVNVTVAKKAKVTVGSQTQTCNPGGACQFTLNGVSAGTTVTASADPGGTATATCQ